jgi:hypothetical protein
MPQLAWQHPWKLHCPPTVSVSASVLEAGRPSAPPPTEPPLVPIRPRVSGSDKTWHPGLPSKAPMHPSQSSSCSCRFTGQICTSTGPPCCISPIRAGNPQDVHSWQTGWLVCTAWNPDCLTNATQVTKRELSSKGEGGRGGRIIDARARAPVRTPGISIQWSKRTSRTWPPAQLIHGKPRTRPCVRELGQAQRRIVTQPALPPGDIFPFGVP